MCVRTYVYTCVRTYVYTCTSNHMRRKGIPVLTILDFIRDTKPVLVAESRSSFPPLSPGTCSRLCAPPTCDGLV